MATIGISALCRSCWNECCRTLISRPRSTTDWRKIQDSPHPLTRKHRNELDYHCFRECVAIGNPCFIGVSTLERLPRASRSSPCSCPEARTPPDPTYAPLPITDH